ncbi:MAG: hypothetical protein GY737_27640 [Desulfobacteraceae bacterium]|nr:hypothetical protein [Desulfobacteraceae bacterium]
MGFKENLLKRITINELAGTVDRTLGPAASGLKINKKAMKKLLDMSTFELHREREMDLYIRPLTDGNYQILVLDNELPLFETTLADVLLRRNPTLKEMISVRNAIKILSDKDVVKSRRNDSLVFLRQDLLGSLDLTFGRADLASILEEGAAALEKAGEEEVVQAVVLFNEILGYVPAPSLFQIKGYRVWGRVSDDTGGRTFFGPMVIYNPDTNRLVLWPDPVAGLDPQWIERLKQGDAGLGSPWIKGKAVFGFLRDKALDQGTMASF